ncbi:helix-turn-helix transcriptional regulator [Alkalihalophilus marmarensis]|uniref:helix-turn-helix transcriptional regulator n=1 Tax=Alkalihalophilus marmarensis TaxID=521377 RepID=UPI002E234A87|nr:helix-turn-helix transcriptional regulator [Alkalihalophilus marmarensis]
MHKRLIANKLRELRGDRTREEVANTVNISVSALQMYENAQRIPRDEIKIKLANYYGVTVESIFFGHKTHEMCCSVPIISQET